LSGSSVQPVGNEELAALPPSVQAELLSLRQAAAGASATITGSGAPSSSDPALSGPLLRLDEVERRVARLATTRPDAASALSAEINRPHSSSLDSDHAAAEAAKAEAAELRSEVFEHFISLRVSSIFRLPGLQCLARDVRR